ncbi:uracil-DNA glycosylase family protein [Streptomyces sp. 6N223]|uniref:uracil-DNA glycosylase family protein n=1 Tax=Streptomyces sp. 6N223 TaxID=3457412 RepID=UPI003FD231D2
MIIGSAPAAHGGNRTGRIFSGDPSGDVLYPALHAAGLASQPTATHPGDGMELLGVRITVWLARELRMLRSALRAIVVLGGFAWQALLPVLDAAGWQLPRPRPASAHGALVVLGDVHGDRRADPCHAA